VSFMLGYTTSTESDLFPEYEMASNLRRGTNGAPPFLHFFHTDVSGYDSFFTSFERVGSFVKRL
ncbi:MAG: hypothetical protein K6F46_06070, partial [Desulfovibrio sp.]|nr:hypothetical protein [Desulfovibrio sp.]